VETLEAIPFRVTVRVLQTTVVADATASILASVERASTIDSDALLATCPAGEIFCTDHCVDPTRDPSHCGGCYRTPIEVCDGRDGNCDGRADEGCPSMLQWYATDAGASPPWGAVAGGSSSYVSGCAYPAAMVGICGGVDSATGNVRWISGVCASPTLGIDRTVLPYDYSLEIGARAGCGPAGPSGGAGFSFDCPPGPIVDGFTVASDGSSIGRVQVRCSAWDFVQDPEVGTFSYVRGTATSSPVFGTGAGTFTSWVAPEVPGRGPAAVRAMSGRYTVGGNIVSLGLGYAAPALL
jgi:hypothetical protein